MKKFRYSLKLTNGKRVYGEGFNVEDAAKDAGVGVHEVKRAIPIAVVMTDEEKAEAKAKERERRKIAKANLKIARKVKAERMARQKQAEVNDG